MTCIGDELRDPSLELAATGLNDHDSTNGNDFMGLLDSDPPVGTNAPFVQSVNNVEKLCNLKSYDFGNLSPELEKHQRLVSSCLFAKSLEGQFALNITFMADTGYRGLCVKQLVYDLLHTMGYDQHATIYNAKTGYIGNYRVEIFVCKDKYKDYNIFGMEVWGLIRTIFHVAKQEFSMETPKDWTRQANKHSEL